MEEYLLLSYLRDIQVSVKEYKCHILPTNSLKQRITVY